MVKSKHVFAAFWVLVLVGIAVISWKVISENESVLVKAIVTETEITLEWPSSAAGGGANRTLSSVPALQAALEATRTNESEAVAAAEIAVNKLIAAIENALHARIAISKAESEVSNKTVSPYPRRRSNESEASVSRVSVALDVAKAKVSAVKAVAADVEDKLVAATKEWAGAMTAMADAKRAAETKRIELVAAEIIEESERRVEEM